MKSLLFLIWQSFQQKQRIDTFITFCLFLMVIDFSWIRFFSSNTCHEFPEREKDEREEKEREGKKQKKRKMKGKEKMFGSRTYKSPSGSCSRYRSNCINSIWSLTSGHSASLCISGSLHRLNSVYFVPLH